MKWLIMVDDSPAKRDLGSIVNAEDIAVEVLSHPLGPRRAHVTDRVASAVLTGLGWAVKNTDAAYVMKLDTDALVIEQFASKLEVRCSIPSGLVVRMTLMRRRRPVIQRLMEPSRQTCQVAHPADPFRP